MSDYIYAIEAKQVNKTFIKKSINNKKFFKKIKLDKFNFNLMIIILYFPVNCFLVKQRKYF